MSDKLEIRTVGIVGGGLMGSGIAEVCARKGYRTLLVKTSGRGIETTQAAIEKSLQRAVKKGKLSEEEATQILARIEIGADLQVMAEADLVIESIVEDLDTKKRLFGELAAILPPRAILASNTSTLRIRDLAPAGLEERTIGLHFFSPVPAMKLVELAYLESSDEEVVERARLFVESLGKTPVPVVDSSGFIVNRLLVPYLLGAISAYSRELAPADAIDTAMTLGCGHPVGPLMLADLIGLDIVYAMSKLLYKEFGDDRFRPPSLLRRLVQEGQLGKKSGKGFYDHNQRPALPNRELWELVSQGRLDGAPEKLAS